MKNIKHIFALSLLLPTLLSMMTGCSQEPVINGNNDLPSAKITAQEVLSKIHMGWNLGNTFDARPELKEWEQQKHSFGNSTETSWGNIKTTKKLIQYVKQCGFDSIRLPVTWFPHCDEYWGIDPDWMERIKEVVSWCVEEQLPVLVNLHHDTGVGGWLKADNDDEQRAYKQERYFKKLWTQIGTALNEFDNRYVIFEGYNEVIDFNENWGNPSQKHVEYANHLGQVFVDTIRSLGGNNAERILIIPTFSASINSNQLKYYQIPKDTVSNALAAELHAYLPWEFTSGQTSFYSKNAIASTVDSAYQRFKDSNMPLIMGEFGYNFNHAKVDEKAQVEYFDYYLSQMKKAKFIPYYWDDGGDFKLIDRKSLSVTRTDVLNSLINY